VQETVRLVKKQKGPKPKGDPQTSQGQKKLGESAWTMDDKDQEQTRGALIPT